MDGGCVCGVVDGGWVCGVMDGGWVCGVVVVASKLYGVNATIIIFVFVLYCSVWGCGRSEIFGGVEILEVVLLWCGC